MLRRLYLLPIALLLSACDRGSVEAEAKVSARVTTEPASAALPGKTDKSTDSDAPAAASSANSGPTEPASAVPASAVPPSEVPASGLPSSDGLPPTDAPRVHAKSRNVWIRSGPASDNQWIGMLWFGGSVKIRDEQRLAGAGCATPWVPVEPRGWVCVDGEHATTDARDPVLLSLYPFRPRVETAFPHRYAEVHEPTRRYERMPDEALQRAWELNFDRHQSAVLAARAAKSVPAELGPVDVTLTGRLAPELPPLPSGLSEKRDRIAPRSALAFVDAFDSGGRAFLLAADLSWVPRDRVETLPHYAFQGVVVDSANPWPLAFFRGRQRPAFERGADGRLVESSRRFERLDHVSLA
ncbi:MAG TPA: hypothetical protein VLC09_14985, partial [Polyangiaceae bacterium]|nr:hypothetical protein [Polyangiaceae bacterium]